MHALAGGVQPPTLQDALDGNHVIGGVSIILACIILASLLFSLAMHYRRGISIGHPNETKEPDGILVIILFVMSGLFVVILVGIIVYAYIGLGESSSPYDVNVAKVKEAYGITLSNDDTTELNGNATGNKDAIGCARTGVYYIYDDDMDNGVTGLT